MLTEEQRQIVISGPRQECLLLRRQSPIKLAHSLHSRSLDLLEALACALALPNRQQHLDALLAPSILGVLGQFVVGDLVRVTSDGKRIKIHCANPPPRTPGTTFGTIPFDDPWGSWNIAGRKPPIRGNAIVMQPTSAAS